MKKYFSFAVFITVFVVFCVAVPAQAESGFYVSGELGINFGESLDIDGHDTDRSSVCDEYINPQFMTVNNTSGWDENCTGPNRGASSLWENDYGSDEGVLFGTAIGYHIGDSPFQGRTGIFLPRYWL